MPQKPPQNTAIGRSSLCVAKALALGLCLISLSAFAQWTWVDKDGRKIYSDTAPPAEVPEKNILKRPGGRVSAVAPAKAPLNADSTAADPAALAASAPASAAQNAASAPKLSSVDKELEKKKKEKEDAEVAKRKEEEQKVTKAKIENCARAKTAKTTLDSGVRIGVTNAKGEREIMDDSARMAEAKRVQGIIDSSCK